MPTIHRLARLVRVLPGLFPLAATLALGCGDDAGTGGEGGSEETSGGPTTSTGATGASGTTSTGTSSSSSSTTSTSTTASSSSTGLDPEGCEVPTAQFVTSYYDPGTLTTWTYGGLSPIDQAGADLLWVGLRAAGGAYATGSFDLTGATNLADCERCVFIDADAQAKTYMASAGTIDVDAQSYADSIRVTLTDVKLVEVERDPETGATTPKPGGECVRIPTAEANLLSPPENCTDGIDEDANGRMDCGEPECKPTAPCQAELVTACNGTRVLQEGVPLTVDFGTGTRILDAGFCETPDVFVGAGLEHVYVFTPTQSGIARFDVTSELDVGLYARSTCDSFASTLECAELFPANGTERLVLPVTAGQPISVVVDRWDESGIGTYTLSANVIPSPPEDSCDGAPVLVDGTTGAWQDVTDNAHLSAAGSSCIDGSSSAGTDAVYRVPLLAGQTLDVTVVPTGFGSPRVYLSSQCGAEINECLAGGYASAFGDTASLTYQAPSDGTYFLFVDSTWSIDALETYTIDMTIQ